MEQVVEVLLAHGSAAGPNFEALVLAAPMILVGIIMFFQKSAKPVVSVLLVLGGIAIAYGGFTFLDSTDDHSDSAAASTEDAATHERAIAGLCVARESLAEGDPDAARAAFFDDAHAPLHDIADHLSAEDRAAAADLLEKKQSVEAGLEDEDSDPEVLAADLDALIIATASASSDLGGDVGGCR